MFKKYLLMTGLCLLSKLALAAATTLPQVKSTERDITLNWSSLEARVVLYRKAYDLPINWSAQSAKNIDKGEKVAELDAGVTHFVDKDVKPDVRYYYRLAYQQNQQQVLTTPVIASLKDAEAPEKVNAVKARIIDNEKLELQWPASASKDVVAYRVYRAQQGVSPQIVKVVSLDGKPLKQYKTTIIQTKNVQIDYQYSIAAVDGVGNVSALSESVAVRLPDTIAPQTPLNLQAKQQGEEVTLSWLPNSENDLAGYLLYRKGQPDNQTGVQIQKKEKALTVKPVMQLSFVDTSFQAGEEYRYRVVAVDRFGNRSPETSGVIVRTRVSDSTVKSPQKLTLKKNARGKPLLAWRYKSSKANSGLLVLRDEGDGFVPVSGLLRNNQFVDTTARKTFSYKYKVVALNHSGQRSSPSNVVVWQGGKS